MFLLFKYVRIMYYDDIIFYLFIWQFHKVTIRVQQKLNKQCKLISFYIYGDCRYMNTFFYYYFNVWI